MPKRVTERWGKMGTKKLTRKIEFGTFRSQNENSAKCNAIMGIRAAVFSAWTLIILSCVRTPFTSFVNLSHQFHGATPSICLNI